MLPHPSKLFPAGVVKIIVLEAVKQQAKRRQVKLQWVLTRQGVLTVGNAVQQRT